MLRQGIALRREMGSASQNPNPCKNRNWVPFRNPNFSQKIKETVFPVKKNPNLCTKTEVCRKAKSLMKKKFRNQSNPKFMKKRRKTWGVPMIKP